jgi:hypothetical protein
MPAPFQPTESDLCFEDTSTKASRHFDPHREPPALTRSNKPVTLASLFGSTAFYDGQKTRAPSPCWRDSTTKPVKWQHITPNQAKELYRKAEDFERQTRRPGRQDGALGRNGLAVLRALIFGFLNYTTGQLDPGYDSIARKACISVRSVARGLASLKAAGVLNWVRRCYPVRDHDTGRIVLEQDTNAYAVLPASQWRGFIETPEAPTPRPGTWGDHPPLDIMALARNDLAGSPRTAITTLQTAAEYGGDELAGALAGLGAAIFGAKP